MRRYVLQIIIFLFSLIFGLAVAHFPNQHAMHISAYSQSTVDSIKAKIRTVVLSADGKLTIQTKNRLIELISNKIKASSNPLIVDIYVYFLREVKKLRTIDEVIPLSEITTIDPVQNNETQSQGQSAFTLPDFSISYVNITHTVAVDDRYATISLKIKNNGSNYSPDGMGSLKFGCRGIDGELYPYWSYIDTQSLNSQGELSIEVPNVFIGHYTATKGFKLLSCKIDSSDLVNESNEDNNFVYVSIQIY